VFWAGKRMIAVDAATGARRSDEEVFWNGDCSFVEGGAACAFACRCHLQLAACDTGKLIALAHQAGQRVSARTAVPRTG
jgi:hypothetical protein